MCVWRRVTQLLVAALLMWFSFSKKSWVFQEVIRPGGVRAAAFWSVGPHTGLFSVNSLSPRLRIICKVCRVDLQSLA